MAEKYRRYSSYRLEDRAEGLVAIFTPVSQQADGYIEPELNEQQLAEDIESNRNATTDVTVETEALAQMRMARRRRELGYPRN